MFKYIVSAITSRTDHPVLFALFLLAGGFALAGVAVEQVTSNGVAAGFLVIYAMLSAAIGLLGYSALYAIRLASGIRERSGRAA